MGLFDFWRTNGINFDEIEFGIGDITERIYMKRLAVQTCINFIAKSISQTEFKTIGKVDGSEEILYRLNVRPNVNQSSTEFWQKVVSKLVYDNEVLIVVNDQDDLLIADTFECQTYAMVENTFKYVTVDNYEFSRTFTQRDVIYLRLNNDHLMNAIDGIFADYGELFARLVEFQKRRGQIRGVVEIEGLNARDDGTREKIEGYINKVFTAFSKKAIAVIPQQKGMKYTEINSNQPTFSVEEIDKVTNGFLSQVATSLHIPISLIKGEMADVEKQTKNFMTFCIRPLLKKITDEFNGKSVEKKEYLAGGRITAAAVNYHSIFDLATSVDKLISSGFATINEMREEAGWHRSDDEIADKHFITKNYKEMDESQAAEGGENE